MAVSRDLFIHSNEVEVAQLHGATINPTGTVGANYCVLTDNERCSPPSLLKRGR